MNESARFAALARTHPRNMYEYTASKSRARVYVSSRRLNKSEINQNFGCVIGTVTDCVCLWREEMVRTLAYKCHGREAGYAYRYRSLTRCAVLCLARMPHFGPLKTRTETWRISSPVLFHHHAVNGVFAGKVDSLKPCARMRFTVHSASQLLDKRSRHIDCLL